MAIALGFAARPVEAQNAKVAPSEWPAAWSAGAIGIGHGE